MRRAERGLTLLEVMAAVAILGLVYTVLARTGTQGIMSEARSRELLEASLIADETLADLGARMLAGAVPALGTTEQEVGEYRVEIETVPWQPPEAIAELIPTASPQVVGDGSPRNLGLVRQFTVRVSWFDGIGERSVKRVSYMIDMLSLRQLTGEDAS